LEVERGLNPTRHNQKELAHHRDHPPVGPETCATLASRFNTFCSWYQPAFSSKE
jgi:hypothetical protein